MAAVTIEELYKYRSCSNDLYRKESILNDDLGSKITNLYNDSNNKIEKINMNIENGDIDFTLYNDSTEENFKNIIDKMSDNIKTFLLSNVDKIKMNESDKNSFKTFIENGNQLFETYKIGNNIHILL